ncbi:hypothetical protein OS493_026902 [Desmophyllum pertusum]|uniref:Uncharacterized protein n=1 Tax=Desmophyllum pertusum TaxID=174260 RepID=A0A9W9ZA70_9CNID|nr:hypothetical protein OS493_026902 [Desmophyllum pertusum]
MRGSNQICDSELWEGTAKSAEGHLAEFCFSKGKEEEMVVAVNWQDADSSSAKSFRYIFPDSSLSRVMLCGGYDYPQLETVKCECAGKRANSKKCGCMSDEFLARAKSNHFSALKQSGNDPEEYAKRMRILGKYHSRDIHDWVGKDGKTYRCPWHPQRVCSCGKCDQGEQASGSGMADRQAAIGVHVAGEVDQEEDSEDSDDSDGKYNANFRCKGISYQVRGKVLTCDLHSLLYEIECNRIAVKANEVIDPVMGKGDSFPFTRE